MSEIRPVTPDRSATSASHPLPADAARQAAARAGGGSGRGRRVDCSEAPANDAPATRDRPTTGRSTRHSSHPPKRGS